MLRFGDASGGKAIQLPPLTLSTILTARAVNGKLSRLALASSPGALTAPEWRGDFALLGEQPPSHPTRLFTTCTCSAADAAGS